MNEQQITLYPNMKKTLNICSFRYKILEIKLKEGVRVAVYLFNENDWLVDSKQFLIEGEEYMRWGNDDQYLINLLKQKIQIALQ